MMPTPDPQDFDALHRLLEKLQHAHDEHEMRLRSIENTLAHSFPVTNWEESYLECEEDDPEP
jgi:hypothetical protein